MALSTIASWAGSAALTVGGWAGSSVVENLVSTAYSNLRDRMLPADCKAELQRIRLALPQISAVMDVAEALKMKHPGVSPWVEQFRLALDASENMLDELEYKKLEDMVKSRDEMGGSGSCSKKQKLCLVSDDTLKRLREAVRMLDQAAAGVGPLLQFAIMLGIRDFSRSESFVHANKVLRRETSSYQVETKVYGRDVEKNKIISWLKRPTKGLMSSLGIVGMGGLGKTTLAQFAYQKMKRSSSFDQTIWVCVSVDFSIEGVTRKILDELGNNNCGDKPLNALQETLEETTKSRKILLVLDDIWDDENLIDWEKFFAPLKYVEQGSKILFTTRMQSVADFLGKVVKVEHESLQLQGLGDQDLRSLFNSYAFQDINHDDHGDLQEIGDQIIKMLKGSPLAAKVIGRLLNTCPDHQFWNRILNCDSLINIEQANNVLEILKLSYYHLPTNLQVCFRFCSIFPQDHEFDKDELIRMWMAVGFICQGSGQGQPEDIGEDYFNHLLRKSFFETSQSQKGNICYVMHDLMHELAQNVANGECCRVEPNNEVVTIPNSVRHISVHESEIERVCHLENLRSLMLTTNQDGRLRQEPFVFPNELIKKKLRLLVIYGKRICQLPEDISCLVHLRYLSIYCCNQSFGYLRHASIYKLYHLQVLELLLRPGHFSNRCPPYPDIETTGITNLVNLRYTRFHEKIMYNIRGVHKLTSLRELKFHGRLINELGTLNDLRNLSISDLECVEDPAKARSANLLQKKNLISSSLQWSNYHLNSGLPYNDEQITDNLQPHFNLRNLTIENYKGQRSPRWMELPQLRLLSLKLLNCPNLDKFSDIPLSLIEFHIQNVGLKSLPNFHQCLTNNTSATISQKSSLGVVVIDACRNLTSLDGFLRHNNLYQQAIMSLNITNCERLVDLPTQGFGNLTSLKQLKLIKCPKLVTIELPENLQEFEMKNCSEVEVPLLRASSSLTNLTNLEISDCAKITSITISLRSLKWLKITQCHGLVELFLEEAHEINQQINFNILEIGRVYIEDCPGLIRVSYKPLTSLSEYNMSSSSSNGDPSTTTLKSLLRKLEMRKCQNLISLNGFQKFLSLQRLIIIDCPMLAVVDNHSILLPMTLENLEVSNCGELDVSILESASHLTTLTELKISNCTNISHIPCSQNAFGSLRRLCIEKCDKLVEHSSRQQAHGVSMQGSSLASLKINDLEIDHLSLLLIEPLRSLQFVDELRVFNCSGMEALPEQWLLQNRCTLRSLKILDGRTVKSLPAIMESLIALEHLYIDHADLLEELPELPASLTYLVIEGAKSLKSLPSTMACLAALKRLNITNADLLEELPVLPLSLKLKSIRLSDGVELLT